jgi:hypothetical protein
MRKTEGKEFAQAMDSFLENKGNFASNEGICAPPELPPVGYIDDVEGITGCLVFFYLRIAADKGNLHARFACARDLLHNHNWVSHETARVLNACLGMDVEKALTPAYPEDDPANQKAYQFIQKANRTKTNLDGVIVHGIAKLHGIGCRRNLDEALSDFSCALDIWKNRVPNKFLCFSCCFPEEKICPYLNFLMGEALLRSSKFDEGAQQMKISAEKFYTPGIQMWAICNWLGIGVEANVEVAYKIIVTAATKLENKETKEVTLLFNTKATPFILDVFDAIVEDIPKPCCSFSCLLF